MYLQCKQGFIEADRWDGAPIPLKEHADVVARLGQNVVVMRSRHESTLRALVDGLGCEVLSSPPSWDYEFRCYLTAGDFATVLGRVALDLDYRNFKSWCRAKTPAQAKLARDVWHAAHEDAGSDY